VEAAGASSGSGAIASLLIQHLGASEPRLYQSFT
jgi:hypothetical protein